MANLSKSKLQIFYNIFMHQQQPADSKDLQIKDLTSALMNALGVKTSDEGDKVQSATIFLSKLYHKYAPQTGKKFNEIKLNRLNGLLYKVCHEHPVEKQDIELIYQIVLAFVYNEGASPFDESSFASNTCIWIAQFIDQILAAKQPNLAVDALQTLLKIKKPTLLSTDQFDKNITQSPYFKDKQISKQDETNANKKYVYRGFMSQFSIHEQILNKINPKLLFSNLFSNYQNKTQILKLFTPFCREVDVEDIKSLFINVFIDGKTQTKQSLFGILQCLDSQFFTGEDFNQILKLLLNFNERKIFYVLPIKNLKCQNRYLQILMEDTKPSILQELADAFINQKQTNNYYLIYLINKSPQKLNQRYITLPLEQANKIVTNRQAIICALSISHNRQSAHSRLLKYFFDFENSLTNKQKLDCLRLAHFSYINAPKSHLLTQIIKNVKLSALDEQSNFQFLPRDNYEKIQLDKNEREQLNDFLSRYLGNSDQVFWIKLDLYSACGKIIPYMQDFRKVQKIFEGSIDQIIVDLPNTPENLLQVVLMGANNKLDEQFMINQNNMNTVIQWGLDIYKKQQKKFKTSSENQLKKNGSRQLLDLCLQIFYYNLDQNTDLEFDQNFKIITSTQIPHKLNGLHFSQYFMSSHVEKNQSIQSLLRSKNLLIQLKKLIKLLKNDSKTQNRKQLKTLVSQQVSELRALKIIKLLSVIPIQKQNKQKLKAITSNLLKNIKPQFENFKQLAARSNNVNINYVSIFQSLEFLLRINYETTISFLAQLLKSRDIKIQQKVDKKSKNKRKNEKNKQKSVDTVIQNIQFCFRGDPNSLNSFSDIITIIQQLKIAPNNQYLPEELSKWIQKIKMFHNENYKEWNEKVINYISLWEAVEQIISPTIGIKLIQRHFSMMIEMLNTLYEKHRQQKDLLTIQKKLLNGIYILYILATIKSNGQKMQQQKAFEIPKQKLNEVIAQNQLQQLVVPHIYYCFDCSKKVCHQCGQIIHKYHDKNYIGAGSETECHRVPSKNNNNSLIRKALKDKYMAKLAKQSRDRDSLQSERGMEKLTKMLKQSSITNQIYMRIKQERGYKRGERPDASNLLLNADLLAALEMEEDKKKENQEEDETDKFQIRSCSQKQFLIHTPNLIQKCPTPDPVFEFTTKISHPAASKLNITPLFKLLIRQIRSNTFHILPQSETQLKNSSQFEVEMSNEKYTLFKNDIFRYTAPRLSPSYFGSQENPNNTQIFSKRNTLAFNDKFIAILTGGLSNHVHYLQAKTLQAKLLKRESEKKYKDNDMHQNYQLCQNKTDEPSVNEITFSPFSSNLIAQISINKIVFKRASRDGRVKQLAFEQSLNGQISKFQWIKSSGLKSYYSYLSNDIIIRRLGKLDNDPDIRISIPGKKIKDYSNTPINSKLIILTILDSQGNLYRAKVDIQNKKIPNFTDHLIKLQNSDPIISINCQGISLYCATQGGKIILLNMNDQNNLISAVNYSIIQNLKNHKISQTNLRFKEVGRIGKLKYITKHHNQIILSCLLIRDNSAEIKKIGFFGFISLNTSSNKFKLTIFNDQGTTQSYDFTMLNQKQFMFMCLQDDGELWSCKYNTTNKTNSVSHYDFGLVLSLNEVNKYSQEMRNMNLFDKIQFYNKERKCVFKQKHIKINDHFKNNFTQNSIQLSVNEKFVRAQFPTGIQFTYNHIPQQDGPSTNIVFNFLGNIYRFQLTKTREIQIPFTIKQSLQLFVGQKELKINFSQGKPNVNVNNVNIHGIKWSQRSVYLDALTNLCKLMYIYKNSNDPLKQKKIQTYFLNQSKDEIKSLQMQQLQQYCKQKQFSLSQQNLLIKLELLRESIENNQIDDASLYECYEGIRNHILPYCNERKQLTLSVRKLCHKLTASAKNENILKLGHILNDNTQIDVQNVFKLYKQFRQQTSIDIYQQLLTNLIKILNSRTLNAFIIFSVYPNLISELCCFFKKILFDYRVYFKINEHGLDQQERLKLMNICSNLMRILIQNYQLQKNKNKDGKINCEEEFLRMLQNIFCISKKQVHKQIKLNPFKFFEPVFNSNKYLVSNPPLNFLQIEAVNLQQPIQSAESEMIAQQKPKIQQNISQNIQQSLPAGSNQQNRPLLEPTSQYQQQMQRDYQQSYQQHKQAEQQNRDMEEEYMYQLQQQKLKQLQKMVDQDEQEIDSDRNDGKQQQIWKKTEQINPKKIYQYLYQLNLNNKPTQVNFIYFEHCQNLLLQLLNQSNQSHHKYLATDNLVFYVGLIYNILLIIEKKLGEIFSGQINKDFNHIYVSDTIFKIIRAIDSKLDNPSFSVLFLPINSIIGYNPKSQQPAVQKSLFVSCLKHYYSLNMKNSKLLACMTNSNWHPEEFKQPVSLSAVLRFQFFDVVNPIYQLKYTGNMYLNLRNLNIAELNENKPQIKNNILKAVVKYNLRVFQNIMVIQDWTKSLEKTKLNVAFEQLKLKPEASLKTIMKSLTKDPITFVETLDEETSRIEDLQMLLGVNSTTDELILEILNEYYNKKSPQ